MKWMPILFSLVFTPVTQANNVFSMDELLSAVQAGNRQDQQVNAERLTQFRLDQANQQQRLNALREQRRQAEQLSQQKEVQFSENEQAIVLFQQQLNERLGALKELFGVLQISATDAQSAFYSSLVQLHYPERHAQLSTFAEKMEQTVELPSITEIEQLWFEMHREIVETGKTRQSHHDVLRADGSKQTQPVIRIGAFNLISDGHYIQRLPETGQLVEYKRQPNSRYMAGAGDIGEGSQHTFALTIDPIRGQLLSLLGTAPNPIERIQQGGVIGYIIITLGSIVILIAIGRLVSLTLTERKINQQVSQPEHPGDNPLGRVFAVYQANRQADLDTLELKLSEAVLLEVPKINRWVSFIKIAAAIAPLMGLLGTVTGMIITFQAITLFGAGDPKLMAGGISQALVTTVLGLTVAIPALLLHNLVQSKASHLSDILEQEAVAMVAEHKELQKGENGYASAA